MKLTKVKGHATEEEVSRGDATVEDKKGNDFADDAADKGASSADGNLMQIAEIYAQESEDYKSFMKRVHNFIIKVRKEEKKLRDIEVVKLHGGKTKQAVDKALKYAKDEEETISMSISQPTLKHEKDKGELH